MAMSDAPRRVRLSIPGMIPPGFPRSLQGGETTTVRDDGTVEIDGTVMNQNTDGEPIQPGTEVHVEFSGSHIYAVPVDEYERAKKRRVHRKRLKRKARERAKDYRERKAREFWNQYDIPFRWDVAIKGRRSGLSRGSWGDGRAANTVEHLYVQESFADGRLKRGADAYLCDDSAHLRFTEGERRQNSDGEPFIPPVTCSRCLDLMDRWKVETEGDGGD
jgi:hypothetical protein